MYVDEPFGVDLKNTVYALDSTTIDLCLGVFPWAPFRSTKAAIKLHTLIDLRGNIPSFVHISDGKLHDVNVLDELLPELGAFYVMDRGYVDFERLHRLHLAGAFFVTREVQLEGQASMSDSGRFIGSTRLRNRRLDLDDFNSSAIAPGRPVFDVFVHPHAHVPVLS